MRRKRRGARKEREGGEERRDERNSIKGENEAAGNRGRVKGVERRHMSSSRVWLNTESREKRCDKDGG